MEQRPKTYLPLIAPQLEPIITANLWAAHSLMDLENYEGEQYDALYFHRQSIEGHHSIVTEDLDILVDAARDVLFHFIETDSNSAASLVNKWFSSQAVILRRLAIIGYGRRKDVTADEKMRWILNHDLLFRFDTEVLPVLNGNYAAATADVRQQVIDRAMAGPARERTIDEKLYETFRLLSQLKEFAPECNVTSENLSAFLNEHPQFEQRKAEREDLPSPKSQFISEAGSFDIDKILANPPCTVLDDLLNAQLVGWSRTNYCEAIRSAVTKEYQWGVEWIYTLASRDIEDACLWHAAVRGWEASSLDPEQWHAVLDVLEGIESPPKAFLLAAIELLTVGSRRERFKLPDNEMELAQRVAERIWQTALLETQVDQGPHDSWLTVAINNPGGRLAEFWLQRVAAAWKLGGDSWQGLPLEIADGVQEMIDGRSGAAAHARIVFAGHAHYFFSLDSEFTSTRLLPLFDWETDSLTAEQSWHAFLISGQWPVGLTRLLLPQLIETVKRVSQLPKEIRNALAIRTAGIAFFRIEDPLQDGFMLTVTQHFQEPDLIRLAWALCELLEEADDSIVQSIWERWLEKYWRKRLLGVPKVLSPQEAHAMTFWALHLHENFPQAVELVLSMENTVSFENSRLLFGIDEEALGKIYPDATADLVVLYLKQAQQPFYQGDALRNVWKALHENGASEDRLQRIRQEMYRLGFDPQE